MKVITAIAVSALLLTAAQSRADNIPYANVGTVAPTQSITVLSTQDITGYFYGFGAADTDYIRMIDVTTSYTSAWVFENQTTAVGASVDFGAVNAGDTLEFQLENVTQGDIFSSIPADSADGLNHAYLTPYSGGFAGIPAGTFLGFEDRGVNIAGQPQSDLDYNDDQFVFQDLSVTSTPEPSSLYLLGSGLLMMALVVRTKIAA